MHTLKSALLGFVLAISTSTAAMAVEPVEQHNSNAFWFVNWIGLSNATLTVAEPNGHIVKIYAEDGTPVFQLKGDIQDGVYRYELSAATEERVKIVNPINTGRGDNQSDTRAVPYYTTGHFVVDRGVIITPEDVKEEEG